jgi:hypothetical protein
MNGQNEREIRELLKDAMGPGPSEELRRDLWPDMLRRLGRQPVHVQWFDWILAAIVGGALAFFPTAIPVLLYHL